MTHFFSFVSLALLPAAPLTLVKTEENFAEERANFYTSTEMPQRLFVRQFQIQALPAEQF